MKKQASVCFECPNCGSHMFVKGVSREPRSCKCGHKNGFIRIVR